MDEPKERLIAAGNHRYRVIGTGKDAKWLCIRCGQLVSPSGEPFVECPV